ncbi:type I secretion system permease/ATPase [Sphingomonas sp. LY160]|uniref:type I secretion system permease/ATPase n=1 Tax=Sphingomonas sp. LY160 TaxID=3095342 RepID=UPI002ADEB708|nr:type I secretion system permease/ATPase [Sphingomonas sp. LY160]MEA1072605.1 type I secretion system permease/ATPase [Sphingomonas sp. LY160]
MIVNPVSQTMKEAMARTRPHLIAAAGFSALVNLLFVVPTIYMLQIYDRVVPTRGLQTLLFITLVLLFALATLSLLDRIRTRLLVRASVELDAVVAPRLLDATLGRPDMPEARSALRDFDTLRSTMSGPGALALFDAPWTPIYILVCFMVHPLIGLLALAGGLILPFIAWRNERAVRAPVQRAEGAAAQSYQLQDQLLGSAESVRALGMRRALVSRQMRQRESMLAEQTSSNFAGGGYYVATKFVRLALQSLALGLGAVLAIEGSISAGAIFAASFLIARALQPIEQLIGASRPLQAARTAFHTIDELLAAGDLHASPTALPNPKGKLAVEGLTIANERRDGAIVNAVSFAVEPGEVVAIIGPSGAGKSTLVRAIAGAIPIDRGTVRLDGASIADWEPERLARHIGYLPQDSVLFPGTVSENIARFSAELGGERGDVDADVVAAADAVGAADLIKRLDGGFDHRLGIGGRGLSAGQAQRIALARAMFGDPVLLILDEPNSHLDGEGDTALIRALAAAKEKGRTVLIVSHKLGVLPVVDKILLMRDGRAEMFGPRDEVLKKVMPQAVQPRRVAAGENA